MQLLNLLESEILTWQADSCRSNCEPSHS